MSKAMDILFDLQKITQKHGPEILTGIGIAGMVTATILAVTATAKAVKKIENKKKEMDVEDLTVKETIKETWTCYIPTTVTTVASIACIVGASSVNVRRNAALAAAYSLSESALKEYKDKVVSFVGPKKEQEIRDTIAEDKIRKNPVNESTVIVTGNGTVWCYDPLCDRYFQSSAEAIRKAENEFNRRLRSEMFMYVNDFYDIMNLDRTTLGDLVGWDIDKGGMEVGFTSKIGSNDQPCLVLDYRVLPYAR